MRSSELLKQIGNIEKDIILLEEELEAFEKSISRTPTKAVMSKLLAIKRKIEKEITEQAKLKIEAYNIVQNMNNDIFRSVLVYRYICLHTVEETAEILNISPRHISRICTKALKKIDEQYN